MGGRAIRAGSLGHWVLAACLLTLSPQTAVGTSCGDGIPAYDLGEQCDDGNVHDDDGCSSFCLVEYCGDDLLQPSSEQCDDGIDNDDSRPDSCRTDCRLPHCGDGVVDTGEECDDANLDQDDGCDPFCRISPVPGCGDSIVQPGEECDDGNARDRDGCSSVCLIEYCGDQLVQWPRESCDDGVDNSDTEPDACRTNCRKARCGDGVLDSREVCDDGNRIDCDGCSSNCSDTESCEECGNGKWHPELGEECDDHNRRNNDGCSSLCMVEYCGDDIRQRGERCDWGVFNSYAPDACRPDCSLPRCGDGIVDPGTENCDDGNTEDGDSCGSSCGRPKFKLCGDANRSGTVTASDALRILRRAVRERDVHCRLVVCDLNGDSRVTSIDAGLALRYASGLSDYLFCAL